MRLRHLFIPLLIVLTFSSCDLLNNLFKKTGTVSIALQDGMSRSLDPAISMSITKYVVTGTGPDGASFTATETAAGTVTKSGVAVGDWTVVANGYNDSDVLIGTVTQAGTVTQNNTTNLTLRVVPLTGTGILSLTVSWPAEAALAAPEVTGVLTPDAGSAIPLTFSITGETATSSTTVAAGYYSMVLTLRGSGIVKWTSAATTVRIAAPGVTTTGTFALTMDDLAKGFFEDFNDGIAQGWSWDSGYFNISDNALHFVCDASELWKSAYYGTFQFGGSMAYQASFTMISADQYNAKGLFIYSPGPTTAGISQGLQFCIGGNPGNYQFWVGKLDSVGVPISWTTWLNYDGSASTVTMRVSTTGDGTYNFYLNDTLVYTLVDLTYTSGYAGLTANTFVYTNDFSIDDVGLTSPAPASPSVSRSVFPPMRPFAAGDSPEKAPR